MPHQCLKCGEIFEDGSPQLLRGCPKCGGNRFFYTKKPVSEEERAKISEQIGKDLYTQIMNLLGERKELIDEAGRWVKIKPKDIKKVLKEHLPQSTEERKDLDKTLDKGLEVTEYTFLSHPATVGIEPPGRYEIDLKRLLENEPIIIQKDGSYMIHLPSAFKLLDKKI
ncbi:MAG TPA: hypothetical protein ENG62_03460 [Thermoplasmatales archaeon]|nr:hypothetical protein [Thermoplasmatales archaeon]